MHLTINLLLSYLQSSLPFDGDCRAEDYSKHYSSNMAMLSLYQLRLQKLALFSTCLSVCMRVCVYVCVIKPKKWFCKWF